MEVTTVYAISFGAIFLLWILVTTGLSISWRLYSYGVYYLSKYLVNLVPVGPVKGTTTG